ncbi:MAG: rhodanese-like domain-containing protein [Alphaproteobacteria bacterium]|jgi:glyoxylase-like metal-dependent hydrolase (beta-lactamase superfamily II)/rhodanese-related sulfurtransferase
MLFRQLFDPQSGTYTYLLADTDAGEAVLIDPVYEQARRDGALLNELGLKLLYTLETHVHADHVTGAWLLRDSTGSKIALSGDGGAEGADRLLGHGDRVEFGGRYLGVRATPGHTAGCITYVLDTEEMAFTGDCLLIRGCGRTDFQGGDAGEMYQSIHTQIFTLPSHCLLYPGHDYRGLTATSVGEEKAFNPRLGGQLSQADFVGFMDNLGLDHPKKMAIAVPANLKCGRPDDDDIPEDVPTWAALTYTFAGIWEVEPHWLEENLGVAQILDVREADEFDGPLGRIPGAKLIPLGILAERAEELNRDRPIVAVCRAGGRSAQATVILRRAGFTDIANLAGGMLRWRAQHCAVEGGRD